MNPLSQVVPVLIHVRAVRVPRLASVVSRKRLNIDQRLRKVTLIQIVDKFADISLKTFICRRAGYKNLKPAIVLRFVVERIRWKTGHSCFCTKYLTTILIRDFPRRGLHSLLSFWIDIPRIIGNFEIAWSLIVFL